MKNRDIIVTGLQSWDIGIGSNCINIAKEFARENRVLYVNRALDRISFLKKKNDPKTARRIKSLKGEINDLTEVLPNVWVLDPKVLLESVNWMPGFLFETFNKQNNKKLAGAIANACDRLKFSKPVLFVDNDFFRAQYFSEFLQPDYFIYYIRDYLLSQPYFKKHGPEMEKRIIQKADLVVANSSYLSAYARKFNNNSVDVGQGCDFTYFNPDRSYAIPDDLKEIRGPRIGYVGALVGYRIDIALLELLAERRKDWNWIFVGPEDTEFEKSRLHQLDNVFFLGKKKETELAAYVSYFDVCINPQLVNEITKGNYPRKVDEYLALGKPVVATYTEFMITFSEFVHLCEGADQYESSINKALLESDDRELIKRRQEYALSHTWENSVKRIYSACKSCIGNG